MKRILSCIFIVALFFVLTGCTKKYAVEFKKEYESLNGKTNASGKIHRSVTITKDNPFEKVSSSKVLDMINNNETFYVYFGDSMCPWCRSVIEKCIEVANKKKIEKIYYVKIWDDAGNEILRSKYKLNDKNEAEVVTKGTDDYYKLLEKFDSLLSDYTLTSSNGEKISVGEKRIFAPNFIYIENGKPIKIVEGISDKQKDSREKLTEEILKDEEKIFNDFFKLK